MSCDVDKGRWYMFFLILKEKSTSGHENFNIVCCTLLSFTLGWCFLFLVSQIVFQKVNKKT